MLPFFIYRCFFFNSRINLSQPQNSEADLEGNSAIWRKMHTGQQSAFNANLGWKLKRFLIKHKENRLAEEAFVRNPIESNLDYNSFCKILSL